MLPLLKMAAYSTLHAATIVISDADRSILNDVIFDRQISIAYKRTKDVHDITPAQDGGLNASGSVPINLRKATHLTRLQQRDVADVFKSHLVRCFVLKILSLIGWF